MRPQTRELAIWKRIDLRQNDGITRLTIDKVLRAYRDIQGNLDVAAPLVPQGLGSESAEVHLIKLPADQGIVIQLVTVIGPEQLLLPVAVQVHLQGLADPVHLHRFAGGEHNMPT